MDEPNRDRPRRPVLVAACCLGLGLVVAGPVAARTSPAPGLRVVWVGDPAVGRGDPDAPATRRSAAAGAWPRIERVELAETHVPHEVTPVLRGAELDVFGRWLEPRR